MKIVSILSFLGLIVSAQAVDVTFAINGKKVNCPRDKDNAFCTVKAGHSKSFDPKKLGIDCKKNPNACDGYRLTLTFSVPATMKNGEKITVRGSGWEIAPSTITLSPRETGTVNVTCKNNCCGLEDLEIESQLVNK